MESIQSLIKQAHALWRAGNEKGMIDYLGKAIHLCRQEKNYIKLVEVLNEYSGSLRNTGDYDGAIAALEEALQIYQSHLSYEPIAYATMLVNLGNTYREKKAYFEAEAAFKKGMDIFHSINDTSYAYIGLLNNFSLLYQGTGNYEEAKKLQLEAIDLLENSTYQVPLAISYNNMYEIYKHLPHHDVNPSLYLDKAEYILLREVGTEHPLYAALLNNKADAMMQEKEYEKARTYYREALPIIKHNYGVESLAYQSVLDNLDYVTDLINTLQQSPPSSRLSGLERGRQLAHRVAQDLELTYPVIAESMCLALVGTGSECLGYDDSTSEDHDFTTRCQLFLPTPLYDTWVDTLQSYFQNYTHGLVQIESISSFYKTYTLYPKGPESSEEFRRVPQDLLCTATNGEVFVDKLGEFSSIRNRLLAYYPEDIRLKKLAFALNKIAQSGQYNVPRMLKRNDLIAVHLGLKEFIFYYLQAVHLLNKSYAPFYKWMGRHAASLPILGKSVTYGLHELVTTPVENIAPIIERLCDSLIQELHAQRLSTSHIDFLTYQAKEVVQRITDSQLREEDSWVE